MVQLHIRGCALHYDYLMEYSGTLIVQSTEYCFVWNVFCMRVCVWGGGMVVVDGEHGV